MKRIYIIILVLLVFIVIVYFARQRYLTLKAERLKAEIDSANQQQTNGVGLIRFFTGMFGKNNSENTTQSDLQIQEQAENDYFANGGEFN